MSPRHAHSPYPVAAWEIAEHGFAPERLAAAESVFAVANGYLGLRGTPEEGAPAHDAGAILNGLHETWPIVYPEDAYGHQVIKQTDVVLATYLVGHNFSAEEIRRTFDYYDPLTTGDSTLSACIQSVIASEVGYPGAALEYFERACAVDLADAHGNTADGIHIASCGGTWLALTAGFGGLRDFDGQVRFHPRLPAGWTRLRFRVAVRGQVVEVEMTPAATTYRLLEGTGLMLGHFDEQLRLTPGRPVRRPVVAELDELPRAA